MRGAAAPVSWSYSGAVPCDPWTWRETPFAGGSDHALLADAPASCQVIALGHWPDRANHSSADTPELVDPAELRRTAVIACATAAAVRGRTDPQLAADVAEATMSWAAEHILGTLPGRRSMPTRLPGRRSMPTRRSPAMRSGSDEADGPDGLPLDGPVVYGSVVYGPDADGRDGGLVLDARDDAHAGRWLRHRGGVAIGAIQALSAAGVDTGWRQAATTWLDSIIAASAKRLKVDVRSSDRCHRGASLERRWAGPVNLRALVQASRPPDRDWLERRLAEDRGGNYARASAVMRAVNGDRDRDEVIWWAALSSELPMPVAFADRFLALMSGAGWTNTGDAT